MAPFLLICMNCGLYLKGPPVEVQDLAGEHMCDPFTIKMKKSVNECKAILDTLTADDQIDMDLDSSNNLSSIIAENVGTSSPAPMAQNHPTQSANQKDPDCDIVTKRQSHYIVVSANQTSSTQSPKTIALTSQSSRTVPIPPEPPMPKCMAEEKCTLKIPPAPAMPKCMAEKKHRIREVDHENQVKSSKRCRQEKDSPDSE